jgi:uncharacterized UPF0146 family protein
VERSSHTAVADAVARYDPVVEIGIGNRTDVAADLAARGISVTAVDLHERETPPDVAFVRDDVTDPDPSVYADARAIYALNLPPELHRPVWRLAREHDAAFLFTTLGGEQPTIPVARETLPGETLYVADADTPGGNRSPSGRAGSG